MLHINFKNKIKVFYIFFANVIRLPSMKRLRWCFWWAITLSSSLQSGSKICSTSLSSSGNNDKNYWPWPIKAKNFSTWLAVDHFRISSQSNVLVEVLRLANLHFLSTWMFNGDEWSLNIFYRYLRMISNISTYKELTAMLEIHQGPDPFYKRVCKFNYM